MNEPAGPLLELVQKLKACPTRDDRVTQKRLLATWDSFKRLTPEHGDPITPALIGGVTLYDPENFAPLLTAAEHAQLAALGKVALERYLQLTHPPHKLGKTIFAAVNEAI